MKNWIWTHHDPDENPEDWKPLFARLNEAGVSNIVACVYDGRQALFGSRRLAVAEPMLEKMLPVATAEGVELHAWLVTLQCNAPSVQEAHAEWFSVSRNGDSCLDKQPYIDSYRWLCPSRPEVREYVDKTITELAAYSELTGIHLDYIRHPDVILPEALQPKYDLVQDKEFPEFDFCYCEVCRDTFRRQQGIDPLELEDPAAHDAWKDFRCDGIRDVVAGAAQIARDAGKLLSAAVFATPEMARTYVRQDWPRWELDAVLPMIYHFYYARPMEWIEEATREGVEALAGERPLYSGLFIPALSPEELPVAIEHARSGGAVGVSIFSHGAMTEDHWPALKQALA